jgi:hypothetical protein
MFRIRYTTQHNIITWLNANEENSLMADISNFTKKQNDSDSLSLHAVNTGKGNVNFSTGNLTFSVFKTKLSTKYYSFFPFTEANGHT